VGALERELEFLRAAWRVMVSERVAPRAACLRGRDGDQHLPFALAGVVAQGTAGVLLSTPQPRQEHHSLLASMSVEGMGPTRAVEGATTAVVFETYVEKALGPSLRPGQVVVMDNLSSAHKGDRVRALLEAGGCRLMYLPAYSPELNPIVEEAFAKVKGALRKAEARSKEALIEAKGRAL
jgi:transposase